ncbi:MAG: hypothetical protein WBE80_10385 [Methylocella sp.]
MASDFYDLGYQAGASDDDPAPAPAVAMNDADRRAYLDGWILGQVTLARCLRKGWSVGDPGIAAPHRAGESDEDRKEAELRGSGG